MRRTQTQWQALIDEQMQSGQTATAFCLARDLNPKYFSLRKNALKTKRQSKNFIKMVAPVAQSDFQLTYGNISLTIPAAYPSSDLARLMRALKEC